MPSRPAIHGLIQSCLASLSDSQDQPSSYLTPSTVPVTSYRSWQWQHRLLVQSARHAATPRTTMGYFDSTEAKLCPMCQVYRDSSCSREYASIALFESSARLLHPSHGSKSHPDRPPFSSPLESARAHLFHELHRCHASHEAELDDMERLVDAWDRAESFREKLHSSRSEKPTGASITPLGNGLHKENNERA